jgi:hypothetical protein
LSSQILRSIDRKIQANQANLDKKQDPVPNITKSERGYKGTQVLECLPSWRLQVQIPVLPQTKTEIKTTKNSHVIQQIPPRLRVLVSFIPSMVPSKYTDNQPLPPRGSGVSVAVPGQGSGTCALANTPHKLS